MLVLVPKVLKYSNYSANTQKPQPSGQSYLASEDISLISQAILAWGQIKVIALEYDISKF